jgi:hypothetical protein
LSDLLAVFLLGSILGVILHKAWLKAREWWDSKQGPMEQEVKAIEHPAPMNVDNSTYYVQGMDGLKWYWAVQLVLEYDEAKGWYCFTSKRAAVHKIGRDTFNAVKEVWLKNGLVVPGKNRTVSPAPGMEYKLKAIRAQSIKDWHRANKPDANKETIIQGFEELRNEPGWRLKGRDYDR